MKLFITVISFIFLFNNCYSVEQYDLIIYGGSSSGVIAGYTAKKYNLKVLLVSPESHLGGLSSGGLGATDIGNKAAISGVALDFYRRVGKFYDLLESWNFEPSKAEQVFEQYVKESNLEVWRQTKLIQVIKSGTDIDKIVVNRGGQKIIIRAKCFIDATYEGDLMAMAGVSYGVGRESNSKYNETLNGVKLANHHQFNAFVSPYIVENDSTSGVLPEISKSTLLPEGSGDSEVQAYNFRLCLTQNKNNFITITAPQNYDRKRYELLSRYIKAENTSKLTDVLLIKKVGFDKTDVNNKGAFSTDFIGGSKLYPDAGEQLRAKIWADHEHYTKGLLYFLGNDISVPQQIRDEMKTWGYPKDEFLDNGGFPHQLYVREARRMIGETVITEYHCLGRTVDTDGVGLAAYMIDSHNCQRLISNGRVINEGNINSGVPKPFPISYRALLPKRNECTNLLVPVCLSASHIAYGSIRMEPVFMVLGQSTAVAVHLAIKQQKSLHAIDVKDIQNELSVNPYANGINPYVLIDEEQVMLSNNVEKRSDIWGKYGSSYFFSSNLKSVQIKYPFQTVEKGNYSVYVFRSWIEDQSIKEKKVMVDLFEEDSLVHPLGNFAVANAYQELGWIKVGSMELKGNRKYNIVCSTSGDGSVVALDAVLLVHNK